MISDRPDQPPTIGTLPTRLVSSVRRWLHKPEAQSGNAGDLSGSALDPSRCVISIGGVRSGTTVFRGMLASHPNFLDRHEIFNTQNPLGYFPFLRELVKSDPDAVYPERSTNNFSRFIAAGCAPNKISVFDLKYEHLLHVAVAWQLPFTEPHVLRFLSSHGFKVIHLRRDPVHSLVSNLVANRSKRYHLYRGSAQSIDQAAQCTIRVDRAQLVASIKIRNQITALIDETFPSDRRKTFDYESVFTGEGRFCDEVCAQVAAFLGVEDDFKREAHLSKVINRPLREIVENYDEIADLFESVE